ncbi:MAG: hypothetical protein CL623_07495 [Arcobacter sp.]|nr:hypothetical protein [Arcobacter sp.]|tara:strand:+ start:11900 stop:12472 length:573 start_codon:yes stop_codon:yes gene_type:complete
MLKLINLLFIASMALFFTACTSTKYNNVNNYIDLSKINKQYTSDSCTFSSYILNTSSAEYGDIFIEQVNLNNNCEWNGFQRSYFDDLFKEKNSIKTMVAIERLDFQGYEFSTYLINDKYIMNLIYKFSGNENKFIIDYNGKLFTKMIRQFDKTYENKYLKKPRFSSNYNSSLVNQNILKNYFNEEFEALD